jgi:hypothetical protein
MNIKKLVLISLVALLSAASTQAQSNEDFPTSRCSSSQSISAVALAKWQASDHINSGDPRAKGPSIICRASNRQCMSWPAESFYCDGTKVKNGTFYLYGTWRVTGAQRSYTNYGNSNKIRSTARRKDCDKIYVQASRQRSGQNPPACYSIDVDLDRIGSPY